MWHTIWGLILSVVCRFSVSAVRSLPFFSGGGVLRGDAPALDPGSISQVTKIRCAVQRNGIYFPGISTPITDCAPVLPSRGRLRPRTSILPAPKLRMPEPFAAKLRLWAFAGKIAHFFGRSGRGRTGGFSDFCAENVQCYHGAFESAKPNRPEGQPVYGHTVGPADRLAAQRADLPEFLGRQDRRDRLRHLHLQGGQRPGPRRSHQERRDLLHLVGSRRPHGGLPYRCDRRPRTGRSAAAGRKPRIPTGESRSTGSFRERTRRCSTSFSCGCCPDWPST